MTETVSRSDICSLKLCSFTPFDAAEHDYCPMETDDGLLLPRLQPEITGNPAVVFIDAPVALSPVENLLARAPSQRMNRPALISVSSDQRRTKSTTWSRTSCGTHTWVRAPPRLFLK